MRLKFFIAWLCAFINNVCCKKKKHSIKLESRNFTRLPRTNSFHKGKLILLIGLEGTLVCTSAKLIKGWQDIKVQFSSGVEQIFYLKHRPFLNEFLIQVSQLYDVSIYTTQVQEFADPIIKTFCIPIKHSFYRQKQFLFFTQSCVAIKGGRYKKEINIIAKNPHNIIFVDSDEDSCKGIDFVTQANMENSVQVGQYKGEDNDQQLLILKQFLLQAHSKMRAYQEEYSGATIQDVLQEMTNEDDDDDD